MRTKLSLTLSLLVLLAASAGAIAATPKAPKNGVAYEATPAQVAACPKLKRGHVTMDTPPDQPAIVDMDVLKQAYPRGWEVDYPVPGPLPKKGWFVCDPHDTRNDGIGD